ncbi:iron-sulfur cluster biosynthesis family protein [Gottschalkia purinilytica]|uniref:Iron-sulfur cluster biosynthesis family protein n=1 Tax=Gottschalkia purinilytica TaxID=1503 RepID=A0A0L0WCK9_GOTPU|nr:hypothetical protein [Gottschalkia purinilytica]KNF09214.1 iron-sulfur cluster biosynthesis family protein [Gottschalkia purinilytica]
MGIIFEWTLDDPTEKDELYKVEGMNVVLDKKILKLTSNINIDYQSYDWGEDFVINTYL